jgi:hypothetical protein
MMPAGGERVFAERDGRRLWHGFERHRITMRLKGVQVRFGTIAKDGN